MLKAAEKNASVAGSMAKKRTPSQQGKASREKGSRFERKVAEILTAAGFPATRNARNGISTDDIAHSIEGVHLEAKHCERLELPKWWRQAERDAEGRKIAIVFKQNNVEPRVAITFEYYLELLNRFRKAREGELL